MKSLHTETLLCTLERNEKEWMKKMANIEKKRKNNHVFITIVINVFLLLTTGFYCWSLVGAYANYAEAQSLIVSVIMLVLFLIETGLEYFVLSKAMQGLLIVIQSMTIAVWLYRTNSIMMIVFFVVTICYVLRKLLFNQDTEMGVERIAKSFLLSMFFLEGIYTFRLAGGGVDHTYEKAIFALVIIVTSYLIIIERGSITECIRKQKDRWQKRFNCQRENVVVDACHTSPVDKTFFTMTSLLMFLYMGMISLGMLCLDDDIYREKVFTNFDVSIVNADILFNNQERLYQMTRNSDGSITSCGNDSYIVICWRDFGITEAPHNINICIQNMTHIYERGQLFSFDDNKIVCRNLDLVLGENNISLEHLPDANAFVRIDLTDYDSTSFWIKEVRFNDYMPYIGKIKECSAFLVGLSLMVEGTLVVCVIRKRRKEKRCEN